MADPLTPPEFTRAEISAAISRALSLAPEVPGIADLTGRLEYLLNHNPQLRAAGLQGDGFKALVFNNLTPDLEKALDPGKLAEMHRERERGLNAPGVRSLGGGVFANGQWIPGAGNASGGRSLSASGGDNSGTSTGRVDYHMLAFGKPLSALGITEHNYGSSPFAANINYATYKYVAGKDRNITGADLLSAGQIIKKRGFGPSDRDAAYHQSQIEHYDPNKAETNQHLDAFEAAMRNDPSFRRAALDLANAKTPQQQAAARQRFNEVVQRLSRENHVEEDLNNPAKPRRAREGIGGMKTDEVKQEYKGVTGKDLKLQLNRGDEKAQQVPLAGLQAALPKRPVEVANAHATANTDDLFASVSSPASAKKTEQGTPSGKTDPALHAKAPETPVKAAQAPAQQKKPAAAPA